jgi:lipopolysaccharide export system permease protein
MSRLASYIIVSVLKGTAIVATALVAVASVIEFVGQLDDVGLASYGVQDALLYVALRIPYKIVDVLPAAALIGSLLGLGNLAVHRELVAMRTSGVSQYRLVGFVGAAGVVLLVVMFLLGESLAPSLGGYARKARADALLEGVDTASAESTWVREGDRIINLLPSRSSEEVGQEVRLFELDGDTRLRRVAEAELLMTSSSEVWDMLDYVETSFTADGTSARRAPRLRQDYGSSPAMLELSEERKDLLDLSELARRIRNLRSRGLDASAYLSAFWGRIANGSSVVLMAVLALPFVLGSLRSTGAGARMIVGLVIGLAYYVLGELSANTGEVFGLDPVVAAWAPSGLLLIVTALALIRLK